MTLLLALPTFAATWFGTRQRLARAVRHPSADTDPTPAHGVERPALKIVEGL